MRLCSFAAVLVLCAACVVVDPPASRSTDEALTGDPPPEPAASIPHAIRLDNQLYAVHQISGDAAAISAQGVKYMPFSIDVALEEVLPLLKRAATSGPIHFSDALLIDGPYTPAGQQVRAARVRVLSGAVLSAITFPDAAAATLDNGGLITLELTVGNVSFDLSGSLLFTPPKSVRTLANAYTLTLDGLAMAHSSEVSGLRWQRVLQAGKEVYQQPEIHFRVSPTTAEERGAWYKSLADAPGNTKLGGASGAFSVLANDGVSTLMSIKLSNVLLTGFSDSPSDDGRALGVSARIGGISL